MVKLDAARDFINSRTQFSSVQINLKHNDRT